MASGTDCRVAMAGLHHEANTFSPLLATSEIVASGTYIGDSIADQFGGSETTMGGYLRHAEELGWHVAPVVYCHINPVGPIVQTAFHRVVTSIIDGLLRENADLVLLALHGSAVVDGLPAADAYVARAVRDAVGPDVPIGITLDLHANVSPSLVEAADVIVGYRTNPHVDAAERAAECADLTYRTFVTGKKATMRLEQLPLTPSIVRQDTREEPMQSIMRFAEEKSREFALTSWSIFEGFPYADVPDMGFSVLGLSAAEATGVERWCDEVAAYVWEQRKELTGGAISIGKAVSHALKAAPGPILLLDVGDNVGGGAPGDSTILPERLLPQTMRRVLGSLWDPKAAAECHSAGIGSQVDLRVGARHEHSPGEPLIVVGEVIALSDGRYQEPGPGRVHGGYRNFDMGPTAAVRLEGEHALVITSNQGPNTSLHQYRSLGLEPADFDVIIAKGVNAPKSAYADVAQVMIPVDTPGVTRADVTQLCYHQRRVPMLPFEPAEYLGRRGEGTSG